MIKCHVVETDSTKGDICSILIKTSDGVSGARGPIDGADSGYGSLNLEEAIIP